MLNPDRKYYLKIFENDELYAVIKKRCLAYREHKISGRTRSIGAMPQDYRASLTALPLYRFDPQQNHHNRGRW